MVRPQRFPVSFFAGGLEFAPQIDQGIVGLVNNYGVDQPCRQPAARVTENPVTDLDPSLISWGNGPGRVDFPDPDPPLLFGNEVRYTDGIEGHNA